MPWSFFSDASKIFNLIIISTTNQDNIDFDRCETKTLSSFKPFEDFWE